MKPTNISNPDYFHKVVDCQWACPAHTPVPEYIRLIAERRYTEAYMVNWRSNVFPGILGRTCDRPCEPACRRGRTEKEPVAICRLKRVAADHKGDIRTLLPDIPKTGNGKRIALVGAGPASLTIARDLMPLGYEVTLYEREKNGGGFMRFQIPEFRLPKTVIDEEVNYILDMGVNVHFNKEITSLKSLLEEGFDAVFVGTGAPRGRWLKIPGHDQVKESQVQIGIDWLASVSFEHTSKIGKKVIVLGGGNTAMDCCRTARRLGGEDVKVIVRSGFEEMKASPWEKDDAIEEDIPILNFHVPKEYVLKNGQLSGMKFELVRAEYDENGKRSLIPTGEDDVFIEADNVLVAVGQENAFPWIEKDIGLEFNEWGLPVVDEVSFQSTLPKVFFGGDSAFGPENIITAVAHGHQVAISIHLMCENKNLLTERPAHNVEITSQKMSVHEWSYSNGISNDLRYIVPHVEKAKALKDLHLEVELGFEERQGLQEAQRCLNCDAQTIFNSTKCIECDACEDICPMDSITFTANAEEGDLRKNLKAPAEDLSQDLYVSRELKTGNVMVKDEDVCLHCGLCSERCPTDAWDMQKYLINVAQADCV